MYNLLKDFNDVSYKNGKFLSDKSYAYDTIYFVAKFIIKFQENLVFDLELNRENFDKYIVEIFNRKPESEGTSNYYLESLILFVYSGILEKIDRKIYLINNIVALKFISEQMENAYIFNYIITYKTFKNDGFLDLYKKFCSLNDINGKQKLLGCFNSAITKVNTSVKTGDESQWAKQNTEYALNILNFINQQPRVTRTLKLKERDIDQPIKMIAVNVEGTRTHPDLPKNNDYLDRFDYGYVANYLGDYLIVPYQMITSKESNEKFAEEIADFKLDLLELDKKLEPTKIDYFETEKFIESIVKARNSKIQKRFKSDLLIFTPKKCAICGLPIHELLIGSHIIPYSKCEKVSDAINYENGLLLCPLHDALFESGRFITIDSDTGEIRLTKKIKGLETILGLEGILKIDSLYLTQDRKEYLEAHNNYFEENNSDNLDN